MTDEKLRKPRRKPRAGLHLIESPLPIPIETITGREAQDDKWYYYFGTLQNNHVIVSRLGDLTFLYRLGYFGKGVLSRSRPQFETYGDVLSERARTHFLRSKSSRCDDEVRERIEKSFLLSQQERLRQHAKWSRDKNEYETCSSSTEVDKSVYNEGIDNPELSQCVDLHTFVDDGLMEEDSTDGENDPVLVAEQSQQVLENISSISPKPNEPFSGGHQTISPDNDVIENIEGPMKLTETGNELDEHVGDSERMKIIEDGDFSETKQPIKRCHSVEGLEDRKRAKVEVDEYKLSECLQLTFEESFFLSYGLGCLGISRHNDSSIQDCLTIREMWNIYRGRKKSFLQQYVAYHYFRSKGWVVRYGNMFGADFALYKDGMPFYHASYSVFVVALDEENADSSNFSWKQLSTMSRVNEKVAKEVLLCYVIKPKDLTEDDLQSPSCINKFRIMEVVFRRWIPEKHRELQSVT